MALYNGKPFFKRNVSFLRYFVLGPKYTFTIFIPHRRKAYLSMWSKLSWNCCVTPHWYVLPKGCVQDVPFFYKPRISIWGFRRPALLSRDVFYYKSLIQLYCLFTYPHSSKIVSVLRRAWKIVFIHWQTCKSGFCLRAFLSNIEIIKSFSSK